jgi:hypothetical protein
MPARKKTNPSGSLKDPPDRSSRGVGAIPSATLKEVPDLQDHLGPGKAQGHGEGEKDPHQDLQEVAAASGIQIGFSRPDEGQEAQEQRKPHFPSAGRIRHRQISVVPDATLPQ